MTKRDLKVLLKECLVELIQEGAFNIVAIQSGNSNNVTATSNNSTMPIMNKMNRQQQQRMVNEEVSPSSSSTMSAADKQLAELTNDGEYKQFAKEAARNAASMMGNSKFQSIFEDTMLHTLPQQSMLTENSISPAEMELEKKKMARIPGLDPSTWAKAAFKGNTKDRRNSLHPNSDDNG